MIPWSVLLLFHVCFASYTVNVETVRDHQAPKHRKLTIAAAGCTRLPFTRSVTILGHDAIVQPIAPATVLPFWCAPCHEGFKTKTVLFSHERGHENHTTPVEAPPTPLALTMPWPVYMAPDEVHVDMGSLFSNSDVDATLWPFLPSVVANFMPVHVLVPAAPTPPMPPALGAPRKKKTRGADKRHQYTLKLKFCA